MSLGDRTSYCMGNKKVYKQKNPRSLSEEKATRKHPCGR